MHGNGGEAEMRSISETEADEPSRGRRIFQQKNICDSVCIERPPYRSSTPFGLSTSSKGLALGSRSRALPSKKLSLQKTFGFNFILHDCLASGNPFPHYAELRSARENFSGKSFSLVAECLLKSARTYFQNNC